MRFFSKSVFFFAVILLSTWPLRAQDKQPSSPTIRIETKNVLVPVLVNGKDGRPITGLKREDFVLLENGKEQQLLAADEYKADAKTITRAAHSPTEASNRLSEVQGQKKLTVIAFDLINTAYPDQGHARKALVDFLKNVTDSGSLYQVLIFTRRGVRVMHDFSMDPELLLAEVKRLSGEVPGERTTDQSRQEVNTVKPGNLGAFLSNATAQDVEQYFRSLYAEDIKYQQADAISMTLAAFQYVAGETAGIPGRKSLIWVTGGFPFSIDEDNGYLNAGQASFLYERTMQMLNQANVAIYPVDVRGLVLVGLPDSSVHWARSNASLIDVYDPTGGRTDILATASREFSSTLNTMKLLADMTGGKAYFNSNDIERSVREASNDAASYYMLAYAVGRKDHRPGFRKITVKVKREGVQVRARKGYFLSNKTQDPAAKKKADLYWAANSPMEFTALPTTVRWTGIRAEGGKLKVSFDIELGPDAAAVDESDGNQINVDFAAVAKAGTGKIAAEASQNYTTKLAQDGVEKIRTSGITYRNVLAVEDGEYLVTFVVRDNLSGRMGTVIVPLRTKELTAALGPANTDQH